MVEINEASQIEVAFEAAAKVLWDKLPHNIQLMLVRNDFSKEGIVDIANAFEYLVGTDGYQEFLSARIKV